MWSSGCRKPPGWQASLSGRDLIITVNQIPTRRVISRRTAPFSGLWICADLRRTAIRTGDTASDEVEEFLDDNGEDFTNLNVVASYTHDSRNRRRFGTAGFFQRLSFEFSVPLSDLEYYKARHRSTWLYPLTDIFTFATITDLGYGDSYGDTTDLPFFEKFRAGGTGSVRGFRDNTLGPDDSEGDAFGGNFVTTASAEIYFHVPALYDPRRLRLGVFSDWGNVFEEYDDFDTSELRGSFGLEINLITGLGGVTLSFASPINDEEDDDTESFQFEFGTSF